MSTLSNQTTQPAIRRSTHIGRYAMTAFLLLIMLSPVLAIAGTSGGGSGTGATNGVEVQTAYDWLHSFILGYGGKFIALAIFCVGMGATILTQKPHGAVVGFAGALLLAYMPGIIESFFTASLTLAM